MADLDLTFTRLAGHEGLDQVLVVGPSLGTSVEALWEKAAQLLGERCEVIGWDLPGHGRSPATAQPFKVADVASTIRTMTRQSIADGRRAHCAGVSFAGAVALELALQPAPFSSFTCIASAARIGEPEAWHERAALVRQIGTPGLVTGSASRWFAKGFVDRHPAVANRLLLSLTDADAESYALTCEALAAFDVRARLPDIEADVLLLPGEHDVVVPPHVASASAAGIPHSRLQVLIAVGHLPPAEDPASTAARIQDFIQEHAND